MIKRLLAMALLGLGCTHLAAAERAPALPDYPAQQVAPHTYVIHGPVGYPSPQNRGFMNNPAFVLTQAGVVVVDPGGSLQSGEMVLRQIRKVTQQKIVAVLNTHVHGDHWLGNQAFREADPAVAIYGHPNMIAAIAKGAGDQWIANLVELTHDAARGTRVEGPNIAIDNGEQLTFGGVTFHIHHYRVAHSSGDLMIEVPSEEVLFLADNANNRRIVRMDDGNFDGNVAALDEALNLKVKVYVPGHGQTSDAQFVHAYRDYLAAVKSAVKRYYAEGLSDFEMKEKVSAELSRFHDWPGFHEELGKTISLAYLEVEAESF